MEERRRQADHILDELKELSNETSKTVNNIYANQAVIKEKVERIERETIKTNGRVTSLETWKNQQIGSSRVICWAVGIVFAAVVGAWVKIMLP